MRLAILSDSHDNIWRLADAMPHLQAADAILHCGDLCSPFMIRRLGDGVAGKPIHLVWGNNDGDPLLIARVAQGYSGIQLHGQFARLEEAGVSIAVNHYPELGRSLAAGGEYGLVCYGHDHLAHQEWIGSCLLLNPGELMGMNGRSTLAMVDLPARTVEFVELGA